MVRATVTLVSIAWLCACGGSNSGGPGADGSAADAASDAPAGCSDRVWTGASSSLHLVITGGFGPLPPADAGCTSLTTTFDFNVADGMLTELGCSASGPSDMRVTLRPDQSASLVATLTALRTTCEKSCGADAPDVTLKVRASGIETTYTSNFYAGCPGSAVMPPLVALSDLLALAGQLGMLVNP